MKLNPTKKTVAFRQHAGGGFSFHYTDQWGGNWTSRETASLFDCIEDARKYIGRDDLITDALVNFGSVAGFKS